MLRPPGGVNRYGYRVVALEWDLWLHPTKWWALDRAIVDHGSALQLVQQAVAVGAGCTTLARHLGKVHITHNGLSAAEWLRVFGRALNLGVHGDAGQPLAVPARLQSGTARDGGGAGAQHVRQGVGRESLQSRLGDIREGVVEDDREAEGLPLPQGKGTHKGEDTPEPGPCAHPAPVLDRSALERFVQLSVASVDVGGVPMSIATRSGLAVRLRVLGNSHCVAPVMVGAAVRAGGSNGGGPSEPSASLPPSSSSVVVLTQGDDSVVTPSPPKRHGASAIPKEASVSVAAKVEAQGALFYPLCDSVEGGSGTTVLVVEVSVGRGWGR